MSNSEHTELSGDQDSLSKTYLSGLYGVRHCSGTHHTDDEIQLLLAELSYSDYKETRDETQYDVDH